MGKSDRAQKKDGKPAKGPAPGTLYDDDGMVRKWSQNDLPADGGAGPAKSKNEKRQEYKMIVGNKKTKGKHQKGGASTWGDEGMD